MNLQMITDTNATRRGLTQRLGAVCLTVAAALAISAISGCSSGGGKVVAVVDGDQIPLLELENQLKVARVQFFPSYEDELTVRRAIVDTLVIQQLLVQEAYKKNFDEIEEVARIALSNKEKFLLDVLFEREVGDDIDASEAEIQDHYNKLEFKYRASHILVDSREEALALIDSLENGAPFGRLAFNHSIDRKSAKDNGDIGYFIWGQMATEFQSAVVQMTPADISSPVKTRFGWHVINLTEKVPNPDRGAFADHKYGIKQDILNRKRNERIQDYFDRLQEKYPVTVEERTLEFLENKRLDLYPPLVLDRLPKNNFDLEQLDRDEKALTLASWDGGQITIGDYLVQIQSLPRELPPSLTELDSLSMFIFRLKFNDILSMEARRLGLESSDEFKLKMKRFRELAMAEIMRDSIPQPPPPDETQVMDYYNDHIDEFTTPEKMHLFEILVSDKDQALQLRKEIRTLSRFQEVASEITERGGKRATRGDLGLIERTWYADIFDAAQHVPIGSIGGPVPTLGKWSIFYVADKRAEEVKNFDAVKREIYQKITDNQSSQAFGEWVGRIKETADITVYDEVIVNSIDPDKYPTQVDQP